MQKSKAEIFFDILSKRVPYSAFGAIYLDAKKLDYYIKFYRLEESVNVYKDVKALAVNRKNSIKSSKEIEKLEILMKLVDKRAEYIQGLPYDELTYEDAMAFVPHFKHYKEIFSEVNIRKAIKQFKLRDFAEVRTVTGDSISKFEKAGYKLLSRGTKRLYDEDDETEEVEVPSADFLVYRQYQTIETRLLKVLLLLEYPYLQKYNFMAYSFKWNDLNEFYLQTTEDYESTLYVPYKALKEKNPELIKNRMTSYFSEYYKKEPEKLDYKLGLLKTNVAKQLFADIKRGSK